MVKKLLSLILSALIAVSCFPIASQAAETEEYASGASTVSINAAAGDVISVIVSIDAASNVQGILLDLDKAYSNFLYTGYEAIDSNVGNAVVEVNSSPVGYTYTDIMAAIRFKDGGVTFNQKTDLIKFNFRTVRAATNFTYGLTVKEFYDKDLKDISANKISIRYVNASDTVKTLSSIKVTAPNKTTYYVGESFDKTGMVVNAVYSDGFTEDVTSSTTVSSPSLSSVGTKTVTVSYTENNVTKTASFSVTVKDIELSSLAVTAKPTTTTYYVGQTFNSDGMKITATYSNNTTKDVTSSVKTTGFDSSTAGTKTVTVSYTEGSITKTASFSVIIKAIELSSIAVTTKPTTTTYYVGQSFNSAGMKITAAYNNNSTKDVTSNVKTTGFDSSTVGTKTITVSYTENGITKTTGFSVTILAKTVTELKVTAPIKKEYYVGESFDKSGLIVKATYNDETTTDVTNSASLSGFDSKTAGKKTITVSYGGQSKTFDVTVVAVEVTSISLNTANTKIKYYVGDTFDKTGVVVTAKYNNGTTADVTSSATFSGFSSTSIGDKTITVSYSGKTATFKVNVKAGLSNTSTLSPTSIKIGQTVTVTGSASGGSGGYLYAFYYRLKCTTAWTTKGTPYTANVNTMLFSPVNKGTYEIKVDVKDSVGHIDSKILTINIEYSDIKNNSIISYKSSGGKTVDSDQVCVGDTVTVTGKASGGSGKYKYTYTYNDKANSDTGSKATTDTFYSFTPQKTGTYTVTVKAEDNGNTDEKINSDTKTFTVEVKEAITNKSTVSETTIDLGKTLTITGAATGGTSPYTYAYYYKRSTASSWTTIETDSETSTTASFKPLAEVSYDVKVDVKDSNSRTKTKTFTINVTSLANKSEVSTTALTLGKTLTITGAATGGTAPYTYAYYYKRSTASSWTTIKTDSETATTASLKPLAAVNYDVKVDVKDSVGTVKTKTFTVTATTLTNKSKISAAAITLGDKITITGAAEEGTAPYKYAFYYKRSTASSWTTLGTEYGTATTATLTPLAAVKYDIKVNVKDNTGVVISKTFTVNVTTLANKSEVSTTALTLGKTLTITGAATGGTAPYKYAFYYKKSIASSWTTIGTEYGTNTTETLKPLTETSYDVKVNVKDKTGTVITKTFTVIATTLTNTSEVSTTSLTLGNTIKITGAATGGTNSYKYAFYYKKSSDSSWTTIGTAYGTATTASLKPTEEGDYDVKINVKDTTGAIKPKTFKVNVTPITNNSKVSTTSLTLGNTLTITGAASGGTAPYKYAFAYKRSTASVWSTIGTAYSTTSTAELKPLAAVNYDVRVIVKDNAGKTSTKIFTVKVTKAALKNNSTISAETLSFGDKLTITGAATGGTASYTYAYYYKRSTVSSWTSLSADSKKPTVAYLTPQAVTNYDIKVTIKDTDGEEAEKTFKVKVTTLANNSSVSTTALTLGKTLTITGAATGGTAPYTYAYYYKRSTASSWITMGTEYGTATTASLEPLAEASYDIKVNVKDKTGTIITKTFTVISTTLTNTSEVSTTSLTLGNTLKITGAATGGTNSYKYAFYYKKSSDSSWSTIGTAYGTATTASLKPNEEGDYDVKINVKDTTGAIKPKTFKVNVTPITNKSTISAATLTLGDTLKLTGAATGGTAPYKYAFYCKRSTATTWTTLGTEFGTATTSSVKPTSAVTYDIKIVVKDNAGKTSTKTFTVKVNQK